MASGTDLRRQAEQGVHGQRHALVDLQALVDPAHPAAAAAGEHQPGDVVPVDHRFAFRFATSVGARRFGFL